MDRRPPGPSCHPGPCTVCSRQETGAAPAEGGASTHTLRLETVDDRYATEMQRRRVDTVHTAAHGRPTGSQGK